MFCQSDTHWLHNNPDLSDDRRIWKMLLSLTKPYINEPICMFCKELTYQTLVSSLNPALSENYSVEWQSDPYVDHLGDKTHQANFAYHDHRLHLLTGFLIPCVICTVEHPFRWNQVIKNDQFLLTYTQFTGGAL